MRKIVAIGESVLDTVFHGTTPVKSFVGGRIANAAASLGTLGDSCTMVSECATDPVGDAIVHFLEAHHVDTRSIDRYPDGTTPLAVIFDDKRDNRERPSIVNYGSYPADRFNVLWPRIEKDDILLFGSLYSIDLPQRERLLELVNFANERGAIIVYLPGFQHGISFRITHVMPNILENAQVASLIIDHQRDLDDIFPDETAASAFRNHFGFTGNTYLHIDPNAGLTIMRGNELFTHAAGAKPGNWLGWQAGLVAGVLHAIIAHDITRDELPTIDNRKWHDILDTAVTCADSAAAATDNVVSPSVAAQIIA